jgi:hypothetical protein
MADEMTIDKESHRSLSCPALKRTTNLLSLVSMRNLRFGFFDDSGLPRESRILMFYSFETEENLPRSGILHYHLQEKRFVWPRHDRELVSAALEFLCREGRVSASA